MKSTSAAEINGRQRKSDNKQKKGLETIANKFKGSAPLKAVKSWAGLYLIQLLTRLCSPRLFGLRCTFLRMCGLVTLNAASC